MEHSLPETNDALRTYFVGDASVAETLDKICTAALAEIDPAVMVGVSMTVEGRVGTFVSTHTEVSQIDEAQYDSGDGPAVEAFRTGLPVFVDDTRTSGPFGAFRRSADAHGLRSVLSAPMSAGGAIVGALSLYARRPAAFGEDELDTAQTFATHAAYLLLNHQAYWDARSLSENLREAMASRAEIEQAKGVIIATTGCTPDEAFERLREQSQQENVKLREIAAEIVARAQRRSMPRH